MEWFNEKDIEDQLRDLPKFQMSNGAYERIALNLRKATRPAHSKNSRRRTMNIILTSIVAFAGVSAVGIVAINIPFDHSMSREVTGTETVQEHTKQQIPKSRFDYSKFLSFTPLLPSDTLGLKSDGGAVNVNHATTGLTPGNYASFDIEYGALKSDKWFSIQEQATSSSTPTFKESQASILISTSFQKNGVHYLVSKVMSDTAHTKSYFWVAYVKDHINYNLGFSSVFSTTEAEEVATHINELDTQKPSDVTIFTNSASEAMKAIHFKPILPATTLSGFHQGNISSDFNNQARTQQFSIEYDSDSPGTSSFIVFEETGKTTWAKQIFEKSKQTTVDGQSAYFVDTPNTGPCLMWIDPNTSLLLEIEMGSLRSHKDQTDAKRLAAIFMNSSS